MPSRSEGREGSSRRSRSRRHRSRRRDHHRHHRSRSRQRQKHGEKNFPSAVFNMLAIVLLCTSLAEPKWISLSGGGCTLYGHDKPLTYLGTYQFFYTGKFLSQETDYPDGVKSHTEYQFGPNSNDVMDNCVSYKAVLLVKTVIVFCFLAIISSLTGFMLDLFVPKNRPCRLLQRNAIPSIITVLLSVVINLFCYWFTTEVEEMQNKTMPHPNGRVVVDFDISFYLVTAAGGLSVIATAFNCLRRHPAYEDSGQGEQLLEDYDGMDTLMPPLPPEMPPTVNYPAPPAYSP